MDRRSRLAALLTGLVMVVVLLAASSQPDQLWVTPANDLDSPASPAAPVSTTETDRPDDTGRADLPRSVGTVIQVLGELIVLVVVLAALAAVGVGRGARARWRRARFLGTHRVVEALPEVSGIDLDVESARDALAAGSPRNAIVACWMQLERDAARAGLPRLVAETSAEYVERVVAASSVDPAPIEELAALYREARFSRHDLQHHHRARASAALDRVADALHTRTEVDA